MSAPRPCVMAALLVLLVAPRVQADALAVALKAYLTADSPAARINARKAIFRIKDLTHERLQEALDSLELWEESPYVGEPIPIRLGEKNAKTFDVHVRLPNDYTPTTAWPLLIAMHGARQPAESMLQQARALLGADANRFIIAAPQDMDGPDFIKSPDEERRPRQLLTALRKRFHVDCDRVFLTGYSLGGHRAMLTAALHGDCFAGVMPLAGSLVLPANELLFPTFAECYRNGHTLMVWGEDDVDFGITPRNRALQPCIKEKNIDRLTMIELANRGHLGVVPPPSDFAEWLKHRREHYPREVYQVFRLAETSQCYWIRAERLKGQPLAMEKGVRTTKQPGETNEEAIVRYIRANLGIVRARVDGQTIDIEMQRVARLELLLHDDLVDLDKPIKIRRNNQEVFDGVIPRDIGFTLAELAREWDFRRLPRATIVVPFTGKVRLAKPTR